jgi:hypothetical protein
MADLPILADRVNDIEVAANAPVTETLMRRFGSNINYLLDFLGITDGSTTATGTLSDLAQAVELVTNHTMDLQLTVPTGQAWQTFAVGTFTSVPFVNQVFHYVAQNTSGTPSGTYTETFGDFGQVGSTYMGVNWDAGGFRGPKGGLNTSGLTLGGLTDLGNVGNGVDTIRTYSSQVGGDIDFIFNGIGNSSTFREKTVPMCTLSWRDGTSAELVLQTDTLSINFDNVKIYRQYVLDIQSMLY